MCRSWSLLLPGHVPSPEPLRSILTCVLHGWFQALKQLAGSPFCVPDASPCICRDDEPPFIRLPDLPISPAVSVVITLATPKSAAPLSHVVRSAAVSSTWAKASRKEDLSSLSMMRPA